MSIKAAWKRLIERACSEQAEPKSYNVSMVLTVDGETWHAYGAEVSYREIMFYCKEGIANFDVNTIGFKTTVVLHDWVKDGE